MGASEDDVSEEGKPAERGWRPAFCCDDCWSGFLFILAARVADETQAK